jgi:serine phosphatase RsbU (regulator of sigma subunit)/pSer/pThr/pTyr-binding forkhead associated (FHA) protein
MNAGSLNVQPRACCWLVGLEGRARQFALPINTTILVGRGPYNHIALDDVRLSRQHARIAPEQDRYVVYDLNSINGTFVNDERVTRQFIRPNDIVRFGPYSFRVEFRDVAQRKTELSDAELPTGRYPVAGTLKVSTPFDSATQIPVSSRRGAVGDLTQLVAEHDHLRTLHAFMQAISKTLDRRELLELITAKIREIYPVAKMVGIYLRDDKGTRGEPLRLAHSFIANSFVEPPAIPDDVARSLLDAQVGVLAVNSRIVKERATSMYVPMIDRDETLGVIQVSVDERARMLSRGDLDLLSGMATPAAIMLENTRMHEASLVRDRLNHDLELAAQIQKSFLPREVITVEGLDLFAEYRAAYTVGGDFYDVFWVAPNRLGLFIGDISGKGVSAALLMARISSELRVAALAQVEPVAVLSMMNRATLAHRRSDLFFTAVYLTIDVSTGEVILANAGHPSPYLCRAGGRVEAVAAGAAGAVGILENGEFKATSFRLAHGDSLVLYTDGVIEASDEYGDLYGSKRLESCLARSGTRASDIAESILQSVADHSADGPGNDDLTLFICQRYVGRPPSLQPRRRSGTQNLGILKS